MLVLSRKVNEEIVIDRRIRVRLVRIGCGRARLGISAPREIDVHRAELAEAGSCRLGEKEQLPLVSNGE